MRTLVNQPTLKLIPAIVFALLVTGCATSQQVKTTKNSGEPALTNKNYRELVCPNASALVDRVIGDGHCVALVKHCANAPHTSLWRPGPQVLNNSVMPGTVIATFEGQHYSNNSGQHAAVFISQDRQGIWVWDQWLGRSVHKRHIRIRHDNAQPSNTAQAYRIVKTPEISKK